MSKPISVPSSNPDRVARRALTTATRGSDSQCELPFQLCGQPCIVGIEKGEPLAAGRRATGIAGLAATAVLLAQQLNLRIAPRHELRCLVGRAVVDHDDFQQWRGLRQDTVDGSCDMGSCIVGRDDHGHGWLLEPLPPRPSQLRAPSLSPNVGTLNTSPLPLVPPRIFPSLEISLHRTNANPPR